MIVTRRAALAGVLAAFSGRAFGQASEAAPPLTVELEVPIDHDRPGAGDFPLRCEWGAPRRAGRRTVLVVADAQQYYVRPGGAQRLQRELFGNELNVLTILGRSRAPALDRLIRDQGEIDWSTAYRLLNWRQWARDIETVIRRLSLGPRELCLYGRSGGAYLIFQLLALRPELEARVYVQAAVNAELDVRWGVSADRFWEEFSGAEPGTATELMTWLGQHPAQRRNLVLVLQRQNFFEPLEALPAARLAAVRAFLQGDGAEVAAMRARYQIDAIEQTRTTLEGVGAATRVYEFAAPQADPRGGGGPLRPSLEALFYYAAPLADPPYRPVVPATAWERLRTQRCEVLQVAARHDHTCDYRTQIGLNGLTRGSTLLLLDDDHVFQRFTASGLQPGFLQAWFGGGAGAPAFQRALAALGPLRWSHYPRPGATQGQRR
ncbi:MAG TPA: hypothetical protein VEC11_00880 [Allosphingosinicella sp.]|nr:hypothetical protein [Allosphingosinicella sp.]